VHIRTATANDLEAVVELWRQYGGPTRAPVRSDHAQALIERDPAALLLAIDDRRKVAGSLIVGWDGWRCHLYRLVVHPSYRRAGVARRLVNEAKQRAEALGVARVDAIVHRDNSGAVSFWEALGFELQDEDGRWSLVL